MSDRYPKPIWRVTLAGKDISRDLAPNLSTLTLTDNRGMETDTLELVIDDTKGDIDLPSRGVEIVLHLGWSDSGLVYKGRYTVDEVEHSGAPDVINIRAKSADLRDTLSEKKERSHHDTTIGALVNELAGDNGLTGKVSPALAGIKIKHLDQTSESDINLLTRLAKDHDAIATVKDGQLLFLKAGKGQTASGEALPQATITRELGDQHRFTMADRDNYDGVRAYYTDAKKAKKDEVVVGKTDGQKPAKAKSKTSVNGSSNLKTLRHTYASRSNAMRAARAELGRINRGAASLSLTLAKARPELFPECPVAVSGFKPIIDGTDWVIVRLTHSLSDSGFTTQMDLELFDPTDEEKPD